MDEIMATASAANSKYDMKARRADPKNAAAPPRVPRKRGTAHDARLTRNAPRPAARPLSVVEGRRYHNAPPAPPRAIAALTRTLGRKLYAPKFSKARWSRARSLAAVAFVALAALFIAGRSARRRARFARREGAGEGLERGGALWGNLTDAEGAGDDGGGPVVRNPMPYNFFDTDVAHAQRDTEGGGTLPREAPDEPAPGASHSSLSSSKDSTALDGPHSLEKLNAEAAPKGDASKNSGSATEWSGESAKSEEGPDFKDEGATNPEVPQHDFFVPNIDKNLGEARKTSDSSAPEEDRPPQADETDADFRTARSLRESLRKEINLELENVGPEKGISSTPNTASEKSWANEHLSTAETKKKPASKFEDLVLQQSSKWDTALLTGDNPWRDLSGTYGSYGPTSETSLVNPSVEIWSHKHISPSKNSKYPYCRLFNACRSKSGRILLQKGLEKHRKVLSKCGILSENNFVLGTAATEAGINFVQSTKGARTKEMDLVDRHPLRRGAMHFFADSLKTLFFIDAVHGSANPATGVIDKICLDDISQRNGSCSAERPTDVRPVLFVRKESFIDGACIQFIFPV